MPEYYDRDESMSEYNKLRTPHETKEAVSWSCPIFVCTCTVGKRIFGGFVRQSKERCVHTVFGQFCWVYCLSILGVFWEALVGRLCSGMNGIGMDDFWHQILFGMERCEDWPDLTWLDLIDPAKWLVIVRVSKENWPELDLAIKVRPNQTCSLRRPAGHGNCYDLRTLQGTHRRVKLRFKDLG